MINDKTFKILFRADGSQQIGYGHVYRLLALIDILGPHFHCEFASVKDPTIASELEKRQIKYYQLDNYNYSEADLIQSGEEKPYDLEGIVKGDEIVVLDGYWFGATYQRKIKEKGAKLVSIDDNYDHEYYADIIINHAPKIDENRYLKQTYSITKIGLDYLLIRPEFYKARKNKTYSNRVFISFGGSDYQNLTYKIASLLLENYPSFKLELLVTESFDKKQKDQIQLLQEENENVLIHKNYNSQNLIELIDQCSHAIVSSSTILMEVFSRGVYAAGGYYAKNQLNIYNGMVEEDKIYGVGDLREIDSNNFESIFSEYLDKNKRVQFQYKPIQNLISTFKGLVNNGN